MRTILTFIFVFGIIVIVHEFGHFFFAKRAGILVREFAIGMGPKIFQHRKNGTTYTIRLLPVGGYVRMAGAGEEEVELSLGMPLSVVLDSAGNVQQINPSQKVQLPDSIPLELTGFDLERELFLKGYVYGDENEEKTFQINHDATIFEEDGTEVQIAPIDVQFQSASLWQRIVTNFAGPLNNFLLAIVLFTLVAFLQGGRVAPDLSSTIGGVMENGVADQAGLKPGDKITAIDGQDIATYDELRSYILAKKGEEITLSVQRGKQEKQVTVIPEANTDDGSQGMIGIQSGTKVEELSVLGKIKYGFSETAANSLGIFKALGDIITGFSLNKLGGPVMIYKVSEMVANQGVIAILSFTAMLSVNLGIVNLVPIPGLDGGKLVLNLIEGVRGKPLSQDKEVVITMIGAVVLILLMISVTWNDIYRFFIR